MTTKLHGNLPIVYARDILLGKYIKQILWASPPLVDKIWVHGGQRLGLCCFFQDVDSSAKVTDSRNEPLMVGAFLILTQCLLGTGMLFYVLLGGALGSLDRLTRRYFAPVLFVSLGVWLARVVSHAYGDTSQCSEQPRYKDALTFLTVHSDFSLSCLFQRVAPLGVLSRPLFSHLFIGLGVVLGLLYSPVWYWYNVLSIISILLCFMAVILSPISLAGQFLLQLPPACLLFTSCGCYIWVVLVRASSRLLMGSRHGNFLFLLILSGLAACRTQSSRKGDSIFKFVKYWIFYKFYWID